ncbi:uncharacterized protein LOC135155018 [Lytechinus pictus]|uniref:uncharacterized protein LOC135155018 n=1 Tax=Lytechinus pictus TaxID=7653 RepID=UPI0030B9D353
MNMMKEKRERVLAYKPQSKTTPTSGEIEEPPPIHLALFGLQLAGKSAFINSLYFAVKGEYLHIADESNEEKQRTEWREAKTLTPYIKILDNKGLENYNNHVIPELMEEIRGRRGQVPQIVVQNGKIVDCPILICNFSGESRGDKAAANFISEFSKEVHKLLGRRLVVVLTHKDELATEDDGIDMRNWLVKECEIPARHVWIFENYTQENHEENVIKTNELLDFLLRCVELAELNIIFRHTNETQTLPKRASGNVLFPKRFPLVNELYEYFAL